MLVGYLFIPMFSMLMVDYFIINKAQYDAEEIVSGNKGTYKYVGGFIIFALACYALCAWLSYYYSYIEPLITSMTLISLIGSGTIYFVGMMLFHSNKKAISLKVNMVTVALDV